MRTIAFFCLFLAHSHPPIWLFQIRNFDVPLLLIVSGLAAFLSLGSKEIKPIPFYKKRLPKLIFPVWIFLVFFFGFTYFTFSMLGKPYPFDLSTIISAFLFYEGFGYVWIFKVFVIAALITPWAVIYSRNVSNTRHFYLILLIIYIFFEGFLSLALAYRSESFSEFTNTVALVIVPYSLLFLYGLRITELSHKTLVINGIAGGLIFLLIAGYFHATTGNFVETQLYKYPPRLYYLSYAFFCCNFVYILSEWIDNKFKVWNVVTWIATHSMWLYLWHIFAIAIWNTAVDLPRYQLYSSSIKFAFLVGVAGGITVLQVLLVNRYLKNHRSSAIRTLGYYLGG